MRLNGHIEGSWDVLPLSFGHYVPNRAFRNLEKFCNLNVSGSSFHGSNLNHLTFSYFCVVAFFSNWMNCASLGNHVDYIFSLSSKKKMIWIAARRVVAFVTNIKPFWYFPINQSPSQSVGQPPNSWLSRKCNDTISKITPVFSNKIPAKIRIPDIYMRPKSVFEWRIFNFSPSTKCTSVFYRDLIQWCMWVFEFHIGWSLRKKLGGVN